MDLALPLHVGHLRESVLCSDRTGLKEQLIRELWLTQSRVGWGGVGGRSMEYGASLWRQRPA